MPLTFFALVAGCTSPLSWDSVSEVAGQVFDAGRGTEHDELIAGLRRASDEVPGALVALNLQANPELAISSDETFGESTASAYLVFQLGSLRSATRTAYDNAALEEIATRRLARWAFVRRSQSLYLEWWVAQANRNHLTHDLEELTETVAPFRDRAAEGALSRAALLELEASLAWIESELAKAERDAARAWAAVDVHLGCRAVLEGGDDLAVAATEIANPWANALSLVGGHPELARSAAGAERARAEAQAYRSSNTWQVSPGVQYRRDAPDEFVAPGLALSIPLANTASPQAGRSDAESRSFVARQGWLAAQLQARFAAERDSLDASVRYVERLRDGVLQIQRERVELLTRAVATQQATATMLFDARRDFHEAEHTYFVAAAEALALQRDAQGLLEILMEGAP